LPIPIHTYEKVRIFEDMPWNLSSPWIVSGRFKSFLEQEAPDAVEFFPVTIKGPRENEQPDNYWVMNFIRVFDCMDKKASTIRDEKGNPFLTDPVIDPSRIPQYEVLGLLGDHTVTKLIRNDLRQKIKKAGFTGIQFFKMPSVDRPGSAMWPRTIDLSKAEEPQPTHWRKRGSVPSAKRRKKETGM
jgi:hypothetical protein